LTTYSYVAIDRSGKESKGSIEAASLSRAADELKKGGLTVATLSESGTLDRDIDLSFLEAKPKARDFSVFCRQFVSIIEAGVSVVSALDMLAEQTENKRLSGAIQDCKVSIQKGETFANSLKKHRDIFSDLFITMVEVGEASGSLEISMTRMAEQEEKTAKLSSIMKKASIYPIIVTIVAIGVIICMLTFVVPTFENMFSQLGGELPALTQAIISISKFIQHYGAVLFLLAIALVVGGRYYRKTESGKCFFGKIFLKMPLVSKLMIKTASARFSRTLATLLAAGISMIDALQIVSGTMTNIYFRDALLAAKEQVTMGDPLSVCLKQSGLFPPLVFHMTGIGEESGNIEEMMTRLASYYEDEVEQTTAQLMAALEPLIIIILAVVVGTIIFSVVLPMMNMYSALGSL
jgi:type IV pilus assembly protein PilC